MKARNLMLTLALCFAGATMCHAQSAQMGTWKLNEAKSQIPAGAMKNTTVVYEAAGDSVKVTTDGTDKDGKPQHTEWTGKFDGKSYPLTGDPNADSRMYKQINDRTLTLANMKDGKPVTSGRVTVSADGKTRTVHVTGTDSAGKKVSSVAVYDKQ
jgi:DNA-binding protein YbaB